MSIPSTINMVAPARKQRENLLMALHEKGKTYRKITQESKMSPNTMKGNTKQGGS